MNKKEILTININYINGFRIFQGIHQILIPTLIQLIH